MSVDRGSIESQLRELGESDRWWEDREFLELPHVLSSEERVLGLAHGRLRTTGGPRLRLRTRWLFVVTSSRLICLQRQRVARSQIDILPSHIRRIRQGSGLRWHQIRLEGDGRSFRLRIHKDDALRFVGALAQLMPLPGRTPLPPDLEPLSWIPGISTVAAMPMVGSIVAKVGMLSPPDPPASEHSESLARAVEQLQTDVEQLRQQVRFLEDLLERKSEATFLPPSS